MAQSSSKSLAELWRDFFIAETGTYSKSTKLDVFLTEFLIQLKDSSGVREIIDFCPLSGIVTLVGCELLCNIHCVTSSSCVHYMQLAKNNIVPQEYLSHQKPKFNNDKENYPDQIQSDENIKEPFKLSALSNTHSLRKYLLSGSAWKSLVLLQTLRVEGLSCGRQLSSVLIWLFDEINKTNDELSNENPFVPDNNAKSPIYKLFDNRFFVKKEINTSASKENPPEEFEYAQKKKATRIGLRLNKNRTFSKRIRKHSKLKNNNLPVIESSDSNDENHDVLLCLKQAFNLKLNNENIEKKSTKNKTYQTNDKKSSTLENNFLKQNQIAEINAKITNYQFSNIVINVLEELCTAETASVGGEILHINMQCISFAVRNLCILQFENEKSSANFSTFECTSLKSGLIRLLIISLNKIFPYIELVTQIVSYGIFELILKILNDVIENKEFLKKHLKQDAVDVDLKLLKSFTEYLFGLLYVILTYLYFLSVSGKINHDIKGFIEYSHLIQNYHNGSIIQNGMRIILEIYENDSYENYTLTLIDLLSKIIVQLKLYFIQEFHKKEIEENNFKSICKFTFHHNYTLGQKYRNNNETEKVCCLSFLFDILVSLMDLKSLIKSINLCSTLLNSMTKCGMCCCYSPELLLEKTTKMIYSNMNAQEMCFNILENMLFQELNCDIISEEKEFNCDVCSITKIQSALEIEKGEEPEFNDLKLSSIFSQSFLWKYSFLIFSDNYRFLHTTMNHLLKLTLKGNPVVKLHMLVSLWHPVFIHAKKQFCLKNSDTKSYILHSCLSAITFIINTSPLADVYINDGNLKHLWELIYFPEFSSQCCDLLEIIATIQMSKHSLCKESSHVQIELNGHISSFEILLKCMKDIIPKCHSYFEVKMGREVFKTMYFKQNNTEIFKNHLTIDETTVNSVSKPIPIKNTENVSCFAEENIASYDICVDSHLDLLKTLSVYLNTCSNMMLYSPFFRKWLEHHMDIKYFKMLLNFLLYNLYYVPVINERKLLLKIFETDLTIILCLFETEMTDYKCSCVQMIKEFMFSNESDSVDLENIKSVCEVLLRTASTYSSDEEVLPPIDIVEFSSVNDDHTTSEDDDVESYKHQNSDESQSYYTADEGYEADVEVSQFFEPNKKRSFSILQNQKIRKNRIGKKHSQELLGGKKIDSKYKRYEKREQITHPEIYELVLDILMNLIKRITNVNMEKSDDYDKIAEKCHIVNSCIQTITEIFSRNKHSIIETNFMAKLLSDTGKQLLTLTVPFLTDLQASFANLFYVIASHSISPNDLKTFFNLFTYSKLNLSMLLDPLCSLANDVQPNVPDFIMHFPIDVTLQNQDEQILLPDKKNKKSCTPFQDFIVKIQSDHLQKDVMSCFSMSALSFCFDGANWGLWLHGCAFVVWIRVDDGQLVLKKLQNHPKDKVNEIQNHDNTVNHILHMISIGHESLFIEFWVDTKKGDMIVHLSRPELDYRKVLSSSHIPNIIPLYKWNQIAINVNEITIKRDLFIKLTIFINNLNCTEVMIPVEGVLLRKVKPASVLIGHCLKNKTRKEKSLKGSLYFSRVSIFRGPIINKYNVLHLMANGPNDLSLIQCKVGNSLSNYPVAANPNSTFSSSDWDQVFDYSNSSKQELLDNLLLTYGSDEHLTANLYLQLNNNQGLSGPIKKLNDSRIPISIPVLFNGPYLISQYQGIIPCIYLIGGPQILLYLYARVIEANGNSEEQAKALSLLFKFTFADKRLYSIFYQEEHLAMLQIIISSQKCFTHIHFLKVMLEGVCDSSVFNIDNNCIKLNTHSNAVILHPEVLCIIINSWRQLNSKSMENTNKFKYEVISETNVDLKDCTKNDSDSYSSSEKSDIKLDNRDNLLSILFYCLNIMIRDDHPFRDFNIYQMNRVNIVEILLNFCKDRFLNSELEELSDGASCAFVELIRSVIGSPPEIHHIALLIDFLILMHEASSTYINHARSNFYFMLTDIIQSSHKTNILNLPMPLGNKKGKKSDLKKYDTLLKINRELMRNSDFDEAETTFSYTKSDSVSSVGKNETLENDLEIKSNNSLLCHSSGESPSVLQKNEKTKYNIDVKRKRRRRNSNKQIASKNIQDDSSIESSSTNSKNTFQKDETSSDKNDSLLDKEYVIIESEDVDRQAFQNDSIILIPTPILLNNLRSDSSRSWTICEGLLLLLKDIVSIMPDTYLQQISGIVLQGEMLLMLGNHKESSVRTGVVKLIAALVDRSTADQIKYLHQKNFFYHLANQISQYPASYDLVTACSTLVTGCRASLEDQIENEVWSDSGETLIIKSPPLIAILTCVMYDTSLTHNMIVLIKRIIQKATNRNISDIGIAETVIKCVKILNTLYDKTSESYCSILEDLESILVIISIKTIVFQYGQQLRNDINNFLCFMEYKHISNNRNLVKVYRDIQCKIFSAELAFLESKLQQLDDDLKMSSSFISWSSSKENFNLSDPFNVMTKFLAKQKNQIRKLSYSDLMAYYNNILIKITKFLMSHEYETAISAIEVNLCKQVFSTYIQVLSSNNQNVKKRWWNGLGKADFQSFCIQLFCWMITPMSFFHILTKNAIEIVYYASSSIKKILIPSDPREQRKMVVYLIFAEKSLDEENNSQKIFIKNWIPSVQQYDEMISFEALQEELKHLILIEIKKQWKIITSSYASIEKSIFSKNELANKITDSAMSITRQVVDIQNVERKQFMDYLRRQQSNCVISTQKWIKLIEEFTHERGVWYIPECYPNSWELDPTEGPARIRLRLKRCHLNLDKKFIQETSSKYSENKNVHQPLSYLFDWPQNNVQGGLLERLHSNDRVNFMTRAFYVTVKTEQEGELLLTDQCIHFLSETFNSDDVGNSSSASGSKVHGGKSSLAGIYYWPLESITSITTRRWQLQERAVEMFLSSGHTHLIAFHNVNEMELFLNALDNCYLPNRSDIPQFLDILNVWRNGSISNWEYLIYLNGIAGRTYNDLMQYPVFPFILSDYTSTKLDLNQSSSYRNLEKPMAIQNKKNESNYINKYNELKEIGEPYHYSSLYSNSGTVLFFLVRLPPFTKLFLTYQENSFDLPDRTFHSIQTTWMLSSCDSVSDVKELPPEFFYLPHFLSNSENLELGIRQCGDHVDNVKLPPWASNPRLFVLIHRQALESSYIRENLPHWIDLVFGYKQTGQAAIDAINVFHPTAYYGFDLDAIKDEGKRKACETEIRTCGQTPRQVLKFPHPHCVTDIKHEADSAIEVLSSVSGLRWGNFCGSPQETDPIVIMEQHYPNSVVNLIQLRNNEVIGVPSFTSVMVTYINNKGQLLNNNNLIATTGLITWEHCDGIIRLKQKKDVPPEPLIQLDSIDKVCVVAHGSGNIHSGLWLGLQSGRICVLTSAPINSSPPTLNFSRKPTYLYGHEDSITAMSVSSPFGISVSADKRGHIIVWDVHSLTYIRSLPLHKGSITNISISNTLCDIAIVYEKTVPKLNNSPRVSNSNENQTSSDQSVHLQTNDDIKSVKIRCTLRVYTVNGEFVGDVKIGDKVNCLCYSNAPEGRSVNVIAVGLASGKIKLYSSWDLKLVRTMMRANSISPLLSIMYSCDSHNLYTSDADGNVTAWGGNHSSDKASSFRMINSLSII